MSSIPPGARALTSRAYRGETRMGNDPTARADDAALIEQVHQAIMHALDRELAGEDVGEHAMARAAIAAMHDARPDRIEALLETVMCSAVTVEEGMPRDGQKMWWVRLDDVPGNPEGYASTIDAALRAAIAQARRGEDAT